MRASVADILKDERKAMKEEEKITGPLKTTLSSAMSTVAHGTSMLNDTYDDVLLQDE